MKKHYFISLCVGYIVAVFYLATTTPISQHEAHIFYEEHTIVSFLMHQGYELLDGFLGLRLFFLLIGIVSIYLFYLLSRHSFSKDKDIYLATAIFMFLPGIITATTLSNLSIVVLFLVLLFVLLYEKNIRPPLPLIMLALFLIHDASIIFFIALIIYGVIHKDNQLLLGSIAFLIAFLLLFKGIEIGGVPSGHFAEIFGLYATVFSPLVFLYFFYTLYRILLREEKTLLWFISFVALVFSLILSFRQRVYITDFAPYVMISIIPMLHIYNNSLRVRLPEYQKYYKRGFYVVSIILSVNVSLIFFHQLLYRISSDCTAHFAHRLYAPYDLSKRLHQENISCLKTINHKEQYQLKFYGITTCDEEL